MLQLLVVISQAAETMSGGSICLPQEVIWAAMAGYTALGTATAVQWRASEAKEKRTAEDLARTRERLFDMLKERNEHEVRTRIG